MIDPEIVSAMKSQAEMFTSYYKALVSEGMTQADALKVAISYQDSQIKAAVLGAVEEKKIQLMSLEKTKFVN